MGKCYYNGMLLPEIPADLLMEYPYFTILVFKTNKDFIALFCSKHIPYYTNETLQLRDDVLRLEHRNEEWVEVAPEGNYAGFHYWDIVWTSYDVPNGSETATSIYYYGNEPVPYPNLVFEDYAIKRESLTAIGDAIRAKTGEEGLLSLAEMVDAIDTIDGTPIALPSVEGGLF